GMVAAILKDVPLPKMCGIRQDFGGFPGRAPRPFSRRLFPGFMAFLAMPVIRGRYGGGNPPHEGAAEDRRAGHDFAYPGNRTRKRVCNNNASGQEALKSLWRIYRLMAEQNRCSPMQPGWSRFCKAKSLLAHARGIEAEILLA
ncbi:MAG: hypothetical protein LBT33_00390, partial [Spirochaetia bacterium]|nr:hypothetical protein [Spirochaetia bacterium]